MGLGYGEGGRIRRERDVMGRKMVWHCFELSCNVEKFDYDIVLCYAIDRPSGCVFDTGQQIRMRP